MQLHLAAAQVAALEQLSLDLTKLAQLRQILSDMQKGYQIIDNGYGTIKSISQGSFNLHNTYLQGLLSLSPALRQYSRIADIISNEAEMVTEYKAAMHTFNSSGHFTAEELSYISSVYSNLLKESLNNLNELSMITTEGKLRMSDDERMKSIDRIDQDTRDKLYFQRDFNSRLSAVDAQRARDLQDSQHLQQLYGN